MDRPASTAESAVADPDGAVSRSSSRSRSARRYHPASSTQSAVADPDGAASRSSSRSQEPERGWMVGDIFCGFEGCVPWDDIPMGTEWVPGPIMGRYTLDHIRLAQSGSKSWLDSPAVADSSGQPVHHSPSEPMDVGEEPQSSTRASSAVSESSFEDKFTAAEFRDAAACVNRSHGMPEDYGCPHTLAFCDPRAWHAQKLEAAAMRLQQQRLPQQSHHAITAARAAVAARPALRTCGRPYDLTQLPFPGARSSGHWIRSSGYGSTVETCNTCGMKMSGEMAECESGEMHDTSECECGSCVGCCIGVGLTVCTVCGISGSGTMALRGQKKTHAETCTCGKCSACCSCANPFFAVHTTGGIEWPRWKQLKPRHDATVSQTHAETSQCPDSPQ
jgi:hypothetical protein